MTMKIDSRRQFLLRLASILGMTVTVAACKTTNKNKDTSSGNTGGAY